MVRCAALPGPAGVGPGSLGLGRPRMGLGAGPVGFPCLPTLLEKSLRLRERRSPGGSHRGAMTGTRDETPQETGKDAGDSSGQEVVIGGGGAARGIPKEVRLRSWA